MADYKIEGTLQYPGRILIFDESDWSLEANELKPAGAYEISGLNGNKKTIVARANSNGKTVGVGNVTPTEIVE